MQCVSGMGALQRPPTIKEFVIRSILARREPAPTLVDREDESPTGVLAREVLDAELPPARASQASVVFDLFGERRIASSPSFADGELVRDTLPSPPPSVPDAW
jgi:hypothetical protein